MSTQEKEPVVTDAAIINLAVSEGIRMRTGAGAVKFARAVLAKWGSPVVAGEPVAWRYVPSKVWGEFVYTEDAKRAQFARDNGIDVQPVYTTPQPTQAQAGAVPLTEAQRNAIWEEHRYSDGDGWVVDCESIIDAVEAAHGIKEGGQHG